MRKRVTKQIRDVLLLQSLANIPIVNPDIVMLGDSNTAISYFNTVPEKRWSYIVGQNLNADVINYGKDGRSTFDYLQGGDSFDGTDRLSQLIEYNPKYYIICFGLNDEKYIDTIQFEADTRELINQIQTNTTATPILMTNVWVDYPDHYSYDRNTEKIKPFDDVKRALATELGLHIIDVYDRFKYEYDTNGIWDTRIRTTEIWDDSQDAGKGAAWFSNIHYNVLGNSIVADEIVKYFQNNNLTI